MHSTIGSHVVPIVGGTQTTIALLLPHYSFSATPHTKPPFSSASDRDALQKEKATSTGQHRDQYW